MKKLFFKIRRKTTRVLVEDLFADGQGVFVQGTFIDLLFLGIKVKSCHKYYISHKGKFVNLENVKHYVK